MYYSQVLLLYSASLLLVPVTILIFLFEVQLPRTLSLLRVGGLICVGAVVQYFIGNYLYTFAEELKFVVLDTLLKGVLTGVVIWRCKRPAILNGILIGAALGFGYMLGIIIQPGWFSGIGEYYTLFCGYDILEGCISANLELAFSGDVLWSAVLGGLLTKWIYHKKEATTPKQIAFTVIAVALLVYAQFRVYAMVDFHLFGIYFGTQLVDTQIMLLLLVLALIYIEFKHLRKGAMCASGIHREKGNDS